MIPKANQRGGGLQLATHLLNEFDNDRVEVADLRGAVASDLHRAFREWWTISKTTQCKKYLYSLSVNPDPDQRPVTRDEYYDYIARAEKALGLSGQPRAVVFHVKYGREHCHVVWSRIDAGKMRAVHLPYDRQTLRTLTQEFARDHGLDLPPGMRQDNIKDRFNNRAKLENLGEKQQEERTGISKAERMETITAAWRATKNGKSFIAALEERGYFLARGDRGYVVVDLFGEIHALARQIDGVNTPAVRKRLVQFPPEKLPDARKAQVYAREQLEKQRAAAPELSKGTAPQKRSELEKEQRQRRSGLDEKRRALFAEHRVEREALAVAQDSEQKGILSARLRAQPKGVIAFIARITGIRLLVDHRHKKQDRARVREHAEQRLALGRRHARETLEFQHRYRGLIAVEKRERRSFETALRREQFRMIAQPRVMPARSPAHEKTAHPAPGKPGLTPEQRARLEAMRRAGLDTTKPAPARKRSKDSRISDPFNAAATSAGEAAQDSDGKTPEADALEEIKRAGQDITAPPDKTDRSGSRGVRETFNKAATKDRARDEPGTPRDGRRRRQRRFPGPEWDRER